MGWTTPGRCAIYGTEVSRRALSTFADSVRWRRRMMCPRCQFQNRAGVRFCEGCGARLEQTCPSCGTVVPPDRKFCGTCGQALAGLAPPEPRFMSPQDYTPQHLAAKILTSKAALEGE